MSKPKHHEAPIVRVAEVLSHPNANMLEIIHVGEYQVVVRMGEFKVGDLAIYFYPDSVVSQTEPFRFIWEAYQGLDGLVPEKRRRITVRKFRGEWSEGLLLPITDFPELEVDSIADSLGVLADGRDVSELLGITHYDPDKGKEPAADAETFKKKRSKYPRSFKGWWYLILHKLGIYTSGGQNHGFDNEDGVGMPVFDVEALKHYCHAFDPEEIVEVTEKIHGSNARFVFKDDHMYAGSRTQWKSKKADCIWRNVLKAQPWIEAWCRTYPGYGLYGEICPTQGEKFQYGSKEPQFFMFDIRTPEGEWMRAEARSAIATLLSISSVKGVPVLYTGPYKDIPWDLVDGKSAVDGKTLREGFVIRLVKERHVRGLGRLILKAVSNQFLERETK